MTNDVTGRIRTLLIDDHRHVHEIVAGILAQAEDIDLIAQGSNGRDAVLLAGELMPDVILMDVVMPDMNGIEAVRIIHERYPDIRILVLSSFQDDESVHSMLRNGASGYVLKGALVSDLLTVIRATHAGTSVFSPQVTQALLNVDSRQPAAHAFHLTAREIEVLRLLSRGLTNDQVAHELVVSRSTVKFHIANVLQKMGVETRSEAIVLATRSNLI